MPASQIACLGLSHHTAPVALREQFSCSLADLNDLHRAFHTQSLVRQNGHSAPLGELVILSTCNRIELYARVDAGLADAREALLNYLAEIRGAETAEFADHTYFYAGQDAITHLCRVAAGLDSLVLGEPQILGQVTDAYMAAVETQAAGHVLKALFRAAIRAGKRARTETAISSNPASISSVAIAAAQSVFDDLADRRVLVIGLGEMGQLALKALRARGVTRVDVANRTCTRAEAAVAQGRGRAYRLDQLIPALAQVDVVISATGAPHLILDTEMVAAAMRQRGGSQMALLDIAVPRDIDPAVGDLPGVHLYDVDDLQGNLDEARAAREQEAPAVRAIVAEEVQALEAQLRQLTIRPFIADLRQKAEMIRKQELDRALRHLGPVDPQTLESVQHLSRSLVNKLLHEPTIRLKEQASNGRSAEYVTIARHLFGLEEAGR